MLLSVGVVNTNRRKRHFKGKVPRNRSEMQMANNYSIFSGLYFLCGVFFFCKPDGHTCVVLTFSKVTRRKLFNNCPLSVFSTRCFFKPSGHICVILTFSKVKKETPLHKKDFRSAVRAKIHADSE